MRSLPLAATLLAVTLSCGSATAASAATKTWKGGETASYTVKSYPGQDGDPSNPAYRVRVRVPKGFKVSLSNGVLTLKKNKSKAVCGGLYGVVQWLDGTSISDAVTRTSHPDSLLGAPLDSGSNSASVKWVEFAHPAVEDQWVFYAISRDVSAADPGTGLNRYYGFSVGSGCLSRSQARNMAKSVDVKPAK